MIAMGERPAHFGGMQLSSKQCVRPLFLGGAARFLFEKLVGGSKFWRKWRTAPSLCVIAKMSKEIYLPDED